MGLRYLTAGESHGRALSMILEGVPAGFPLDEVMIDAELTRRQKGAGSGKRMQIENDRVEVLSGVMGGKTTGGPISAVVWNRDHENWAGKEVSPMTRPRPGHVDLAAAAKYRYSDLRFGLERGSARETAARVVIGAICKQVLSVFGVKVYGYVHSIGSVSVGELNEPIDTLYERSERSPVRCPQPEIEQGMIQAIQEAKGKGDTLGGIIELVAVGVPAGLGSHVHSDRRLDARLGGALLGIQAIKGVEIGPAFQNTRLPGTQVQDPILLQEGRVVRGSNRAGGIEGGISNGQPILLRTAMKPIASTLHPQPTVDLATREEAETTYERSDVCPVPRAVPVLEAVVAFVLADALLEKLGGDSLEEILPRFKALPGLDLGDFKLENTPRIFWKDTK